MLHLIKHSMVFGFALVVMVLNSSLSANGQTISDSPLQAPTSSLAITAAANGDGVRITAPSSIVQMHVEVYAAGGEKLFDQEIRGGNVFDWHLEDSQAQRLAPGAYVCVVTARSVSGRLTQKLGAVTVAEKSASVQAGPIQLSPQQTQAIGPVADDSSWTIAGENEPQTPTVIAHDGADGQMIRGRGALTFRVGNFFSGIDTEQMRLTEAGNLGIGTSQPQSKLEVAGTIRAERFMVVKPNLGSGDQTAAAAATQAIDGTDGVQPLIAGTGTQNQIAKWTDNAGTLGDSGITENGANIGIGTTTPGAPLEAFKSAGANVNGGGLLVSRYHDGAGTFRGGSIYSRFIGGSVNDDALVFGVTSTGTKNPYTDFDQARMSILASGKVGIGTTSPGAPLEAFKSAGANATGGGLLVSRFNDGAGTFRGGAIYSRYISNEDALVFGVTSTGTKNPYTDFDQARMAIFANGNVGIGTTNPVSKLDVAGDINTSTQYNIAGIRVLDIKATNTFAGVGAGVFNAGDNNTFVGNMAGSSKNSGDGNAFFGSFAGNSNAGGNGNAFFGFEAGKGNINGGTNSFFGFQAGRQNTNAAGNSFFGALSGAMNTIGQFNSFVGYQAGNGNEKGDGNSFFGNGAGSDNTTGSFNVSIGYAAGNGPGVGNQNGSNNVSIGYASGQISGNNQSGASNNTFIGAGARGENNDTAVQSYATAIGAGAVASGNTGVWLGRKGLDDVTVGRLLTIGLFDHVGAGEELCRSIPESYGPSDLVSICSSSLRYKTDVKTYLGGLDIVRRLRPITFNWRKTGHHDLGFGAEEVEQVEPLLVFYNEKGETDGVKYRQITAVLVNAVNEQQTQITAQQRTIEQQKLQLEEKDSQIESLKAGLARQETRLAAVESRVNSLTETRVAGESRAAARPNQ